MILSTGDVGRVFYQRVGFCIIGNHLNAAFTGQETVDSQNGGGAVVGRQGVDRIAVIPLGSQVHGCGATLIAGKDVGFLDRVDACDGRHKPEARRKSDAKTDAASLLLQTAVGRPGPGDFCALELIQPPTSKAGGMQQGPTRISCYHNRTPNGQPVS